MRLPPRSCLAGALGLAMALAWSPAAGAAPGDDDYQARYDRARSLALEGRRDEAIGLYTALLAESPDNADLLLARGRVHAWERDWAAADADLQAAVRLAPDYADAWVALADAYRWSGRPADAARAQARAVALGAAPVAATTATDVTVPDAERWSASAWFGATDAGAGGTWHDHGMAIRRHGDRGTVGLEALQAHRFGRTERAWAVDAYADAWQGAYANLRYQWGGESLFADRVWRVELFQGLAGGWELTAHHDRIDFADASVRMAGLGLGRYWGNVYARVVASRIEDDTGGATGARGLVRWYYRGRADDWFELAGGRGRSAGDLASRGGDVRLRTDTLSLGWTRRRGDWGVRLGASYADDAGAGRVERGASATLTRWW